MIKYLSVFLFLISSVCFGQTLPPQYCAIESRPTYNIVNLLRNSEGLNNTTAYTAVAGISVTADDMIAPDGTTSAERLTATAGNNVHRLSSTSGTNRPSAPTAGEQFRLSAFLRQGTHRFVALADNGDDVGRGVTVDLQTCTTTLNTNIDTSSAVSASDGWCRVTITYTRTSVCGGCKNATGDIFIVQNSSMAPNTSWTAAGTETVHAWGMQLNRIANSTTYLRTGDAANTGVLSDTSTQVTLRNIALWSEQFDNAAWVKVASTITANTAAAPNGANTADKIVETATTNVHGFYTAAPLYTLTANITYRWSAYLKAAERTWALLRPWHNGVGYDTYFDLTNCTVGTNAAGSTASAVSVGNGWCRVTITRTIVTTATDGYHIIYTSTGDGVSSYLGTAGSGILVWGAQLQPAASPPDYLQTTTVAATFGPICPEGTTYSLLDSTRCINTTRKGRQSAL